MKNKRKRKRRLSKSIKRMKKDRLDNAFRKILEERGYFK